MRSGKLRSLRCGKYVGGPPTPPFATGIPHTYLIGSVNHRSQVTMSGRRKSCELSRHCSLLSMHTQWPLRGPKVALSHGAVLLAAGAGDRSALETSYSLC